MRMGESARMRLSVRMGVSVSVSARMGVSVRIGARVMHPAQPLRGVGRACIHNWCLSCVDNQLIKEKLLMIIMIHCTSLLKLFHFPEHKIGMLIPIR